MNAKTKKIALIGAAVAIVGVGATLALRRLMKTSCFSSRLRKLLLIKPHKDALSAWAVWWNRAL